MATETGMMAQYFAIKKEHKNAVLMFQVGGFYQLYYNDAEIASAVLETKLVSRVVGGGQRIPMCGVPKAAGERYAEVFAQKGYCTILCNQTDKKDEEGITIREISKEVRPDSDVEALDLSQSWDEYLNTHTFEELKPPERKQKKKAAEKNILDELTFLDLNSTTPMEALNLLQEWKQKYARPHNSAHGL